MNNSIIKLVLMGLVAGVIVLSGAVVSAEEGMANQTVNLTGKIVSIDLEKSAITVEQAADMEGEGVKQVVLSVNDTTSIKKAEEPIGLGDLVVGQTVSVEGMVDEAGMLTAWYVQLEE